MISGLPKGVNGILVRLNIDYEKKARGELTAECRCVIPSGDTREEVSINTTITDTHGDVVTTATATWLVGPQ
jgi:acyl-coenzyme A thioesterase PaaI-like protein